MINREILKSLVDYDPDTGVMVWRNPSGRVKPGTEISCADSRGYLVVRLQGALYRVHRLAWLYVHGETPAVIDHINGLKSDNRLANLRSCTTQENTRNRFRQLNNTSGFVGVSFHKRRGKFRACIVNSGKQTCIGYFDTAEQASAAYMQHAKQTFGEFYKELQP